MRNSVLHQKDNYTSVLKLCVNDFEKKPSCRLEANNLVRFVL